MTRPTRRIRSLLLTCEESARIFLWQHFGEADGISSCTVYQWEMNRSNRYAAGFSHSYASMYDLCDYYQYQRRRCQCVGDGSIFLEAWRVEILIMRF